MFLVTAYKTRYYFNIERYGLVNSLAPGRFEQNFRYVIFKLISVPDSWGMQCTQMNSTEPCWW